MTVTKLALDRAPGKARVALDRKSVRSTDRDGRLHIGKSNISKATVDPYYGHEIPDGEALGLDPRRVYYLLRDPEELAKGASTFNNLPILRNHTPVSADDHQPDEIIGSTGTDAVFDGEYLQNSSVVWVADDIDDIESERKKEWSCGYYYRADMTPGKFNGLRYDGVMRDIVGNHLALVDQGRAGPDVVVGDELPEGFKMLKSRRALLLHGAIAGLIAPRMATDAKPIDLRPALAGVSAKTRGKDHDKLGASIFALVSPVLAQDAEMDVSDVVAIIKAVDGVDDTPVAQDDLTPADIEDDDDDKPAEDEDPDGDDDDKANDEEPENQPGNPPQAHDAARIRRDTLREAAAIREAERAVRPHIGEVTVALDSAAAVYKLALDHAGVDLNGVPKSAYKAMVGMLKTDAAPKIAVDHAASVSGFAGRFPDANVLR